MKYCIVVEPNTVDPKLATATLFDLLGDPSVWMDNHEVKFFSHEDKGVAEWAEEINDIAKPMSVIEDFASLDETWIVLGPTVEEYVKDATAAGAKYLALDDGLVELAIEEEAPEVPIVPDVEEKAEEKAEDAPEVPAIPKRRQSRAKKPVVEEAKPEFEEAVAEALEVAKPDVDLEPPAQDVKGEMGEMVFGPRSMPISVLLQDLIGAMLEKADEDQLWEIAQSIRGVLKWSAGVIK